MTDNRRVGYLSRQRENKIREPTGRGKLGTWGGKEGLWVEYGSLGCITREIEPMGHIQIYRKRFITRDWLT